jgi:hypothetical protein
LPGAEFEDEAVLTGWVLGGGLEVVEDSTGEAGTVDDVVVVGVVD